MSTKIEWVKNTDGTQGRTWNVVTGCTPASEGCTHCYAKALHDMRHKAWLDGWVAAPAQYHKPFSEVQLLSERLEDPLHWRKPQTVFVCSVSDLFHDDVPDEYIDRVNAVMAWCPQHTFIIVSKRAERMHRYYTDEALPARLGWLLCELHHGKQACEEGYWSPGTGPKVPMPLPQKNVVLMVTAENQEQADHRIPYLLQTPAVLRGVSVEPMLGSVDLRHLDYERISGIDALAGTHGVIRPHRGECAKLDWVICGGETSPGARPVHPDWVRSLRDQCKAAQVPFFFKSWGDWVPTDLDPEANYTVTRENATYRHVNYAGGQGFHGDRLIIAHKVGKKAAGALLDGQEYHQMPERGAAS